MTVTQNCTLTCHNLDKSHMMPPFPHAHFHFVFACCDTVQIVINGDGNKELALGEGSELPLTL